MAPCVFGVWFFNTQKQLQFFITIHFNVLPMCWFCLMLLIITVYLTVYFSPDKEFAKKTSEGQTAAHLGV
jgi:hypothetical protein